MAKKGGARKAQKGGGYAQLSKGQKQARVTKLTNARVAAGGAARQAINFKRPPGTRATG